MTLIARWGTSCGTPFDSGLFFKTHIQWMDQKPYVYDRPGQPWTEFSPLNNIKPTKNKTKAKVERIMKLKRTFKKSTAKPQL
jgi:hypothetical protein